MHRFIWKTVSETLAERSTAQSLISSPALLQSLRLLGSISTTTSDDSDSDCSSSYNNCSKQQESSPNRAPPVLKFFQDSGFSLAQAESIVSRYPIFLRCHNPGKTLKPKINFLHSIGIPQADIAIMVTRYPLVLRRTVNNHLIPSFDLLKSLLGGEHNAIWLVKRCTSVLYCNIANTMAVNLSTLKNHGVPISVVLKMMTSSKFTEVMEVTKPERFSKVVERVIKMGFDTSSVSFGNAVTAMGICNKSTWEEKLEFFQDLGFSKDETLSMFRKQPLSLCLSQKKVREAVEFYNDKFHWGPPELMMRPNLLLYGLHSRVIPRCSVLQVLWSRNRIKKIPRLISVLVLTNKVFMETYVTKYEGEVPEVLDAYQGKLHFDVFTFYSGKTVEAKAV